jgi:hypothetical protein
MWAKYRIFRLLDEAGAGDGSGAPAASGAVVPAATPGAPAPAATGTSGEPSALAAAAATASAFEFPEKYRVVGADGKVDADASARKTVEGYNALAKRIGTGDAPPASAAEYQITVPDSLKDAIDPAKDPGLQAFTAKAHAAGLTQKQLDMVMGEYFEMAPKLAAGAVAADAATATAELAKSWTSEAAMKQGMQHAYAGTKAAAEKAGLDLDNILAGPLANNPEFIKLMAALGPEFQEDPGLGVDPLKAGETLEDLMASEAYSNPNHKDHVSVSEKVRRAYERKIGMTEVR